MARLSRGRKEVSVIIRINVTVRKGTYLLFRPEDGWETRPGHEDVEERRRFYRANRGRTCVVRSIKTAISGEPKFFVDFNLKRWRKRRRKLMDQGLVCRWVLPRDLLLLQHPAS